MLAAAAQIRAHVIPGLHAVAEPSGTIDASTYLVLKGALLQDIREALPLDAIALELHGAGVAEGVEDLEGDLAGAVRRTVGPDIPIVAPLDLHANITAKMAEALDLMLGVNFYPHIDAHDRGFEAVSALPSLIARSLRPTPCVLQLPMLLPWSWTESRPTSQVNELCWALEESPSVVDCTFFHGFPMADVPAASSSVVATTRGDPTLAAKTAATVARFVWDNRDDFVKPMDTPEQGVRRALSLAKQHGGPIIINESSDNPGGGAPGDSTHLLRALLAARPDAACFGYLYDPEVASAAHASGVGSRIDVKLGGKSGELQGAPLQLRCSVKAVSDGRFVHPGPVQGGVPANLGPMACLTVDGVDVLVGSEREQTLDPELFVLHGLDLSRYGIVALKSSVHFRAGFAGIARAVISVDAPGLTTQNIATFPRAHATRPLWPIDVSATFE